MLAVAVPRLGTLITGSDLRIGHYPKRFSNVPQRKLSGATSAAAAAVESSLGLLSKTHCEAGAVGRDGCTSKECFRARSISGPWGCGVVSAGECLAGQL